MTLDPAKSPPPRQARLIVQRMRNGQQMHVMDRLANLPIRDLEDR